MVGRLHSCVGTGAGTYCWGSNVANELGDNSRSNQNRPVLQSTLSGFTQLSAGNAYNCAVVGGGIRCWGYDRDATLGTTSVSNGLMSGCPISQPCGSNTPVSVEQIGGGGTFAGAATVTTGVSHACAITTAGALACWGYNYSGELGSVAGTSSQIPVQVSGLTSGVTSVFTGAARTTCAIVAGAAQCWGDNGSGQVGDGSNTSSNVPVAVTGLGSGVTAIAIGSAHSCAVQSGSVFCWGNNGFGQLGDGTTTDRLIPTQVLGLTSGATAVALGDYFSCALVSGGVQCWGYNNSGQLGTGSAQGYLATPAAVVGLSTGVRAVGAGEIHACALVANQIQCWGDNTVGELGDGTNISQATPVVVANPQLVRGQP